MELTAQQIDDVVRLALAEDVGDGDLTTSTVVAADVRCRAGLWLEEPGVVCGVAVVAAVFQALDRAVGVEPRIADGTAVTEAPALLAELFGPAQAILIGERTALNLLGRLCGVATITRRFVELVDGTGVAILDTRKTTPGLRGLERYAVRCGGGTNHRFGLHDAVLIKENHIRLGGGVEAAIAAARATGLPVEVEAETLEDVRVALGAGAERILLDNMTSSGVAEAVALVGGRAETEASGGVSLATVRSFAESGVDFISVGALTHAARSLQVSLEVQ